MDWLRYVELGARIGTWVIDTVGRFVNGDDSEEVRRLIEILPAELQADVAHAKQYALMKQSLEEKLPQ